MTDKKIIWDYLEKKGYSDYGIAGIMGNLYAESGLKSNNLQNTFNKRLNLSDEEYTQKVNNNTYSNFIKDGAGYGLAQWTYWSRKQQLLNLSKKRGVSISDLTLQLDFLCSELNTNYKNLSQYLKNSKSIQESSKRFLLEFERPADQSIKVQNIRLSYATNFYQRYGHSTQNILIPDEKQYLPILCLQKNSTCFKSTRKMEIKGILWHSTGANNPTLKRYIQPSPDDKNYNNLIELIGINKNHNDYNHISAQVGLNAWIGKDSHNKVRVIQTMPWDYRPWGCGSGPKGSCNSGWIQFEICEDNLKDEKYFKEIYQAACSLTAYLCQKYGIDPLGNVNYNGIAVPTILCHADSYKLGLGSNHSDVYHWFQRYGKDMNTVRQDVKAILDKKNNNHPNEKDPTITPPILQPQINNNINKEGSTVTQEQFNKMMNNWINEQSKKEPGAWSQKERLWAEQEGLVKGNANNLKMYKKPLTREEFIVVLYRALHRYFM